jgi:hypothetical protein
MTHAEPGLYYHYKNKEHQYRLLGIAKHRDTLEECVVYEALYANPESRLWIGPRDVFDEFIEVNGKKIKRFTRIDAIDSKE